MSALSIAFPAEAAVPVAEAFIGAAAVVMRPLMGIMLLSLLLFLFRPLIVGMVRAALLFITPRKSLKERWGELQLLMSRH